MLLLDATQLPQGKCRVLLCDAGIISRKDCSVGIYAAQGERGNIEDDERLNGGGWHVCQTDVTQGLKQRNAFDLTKLRER